MKICEHLPKCSCHRSQQGMNTSSSEHLVSHVTTHEHLIEIVQYMVKGSELLHK